VTDDELTDRWEAGQVFDGGVTHEQHVRIAWILHRRHGAADAKARLLTGTRRACERHGCTEKFDAGLTERWSDAVAGAMQEHGPGASASAFLLAHPHLARGDLFGGAGRS
jgi:hypothetical protein